MGAKGAEQEKNKRSRGRMLMFRDRCPQRTLEEPWYCRLQTARPMEITRNNLRKHGTKQDAGNMGSVSIVSSCTSAIHSITSSRVVASCSLYLNRRSTKESKRYHTLPPNIIIRRTRISNFQGNPYFWNAPACFYRTSSKLLGTLENFIRTVSRFPPIGYTP
jgi:hypothetical protein